MALNPTLPEIIWTVIGLTGFIISVVDLYQAIMDRRALHLLKVNGARSLIVSRDILKAILYITGCLAVTLSGVAAIILFPQAPTVGIFQQIRAVFPWLLIVVGGSLCILPANDFIARRKFMYLTVHKDSHK